MATSIYPEWPPRLNPEQEEYLVSNIKDWSVAHGLAVRPSPAFVPSEIDPTTSLATTAPVTLFPSPFPRPCFQEARAIQETYNTLYASIARDEKWLGEIVQELLEVDDFIEKLWNVHVAVKKEGYIQIINQDLTLGLFRSDYMVHVEDDASPSLRQVEFNTIASSFGGLSTLVSQLHSHLFKLPAYPSNPHLVPTAFPENSTAGTLAAGLASAHAAYGDSKTQPSRPLCMLIIVQSNEHNIFDQYALTSILQSDYSVPTFRLPFSSTLALTEISSSDPSRVLLYKPPHCSSNLFEVSVLYFRAAYTPSDYPTDTAWSARLHLERSAAIKCPSILTHLAGSKKIQQVLAIPGSPHLSRFLEPANVSPENIERVRATFAAIYPLDDSDVGRTARSLALDDTDAKKFVLKPQREGGGNNIYRSAIPKFLRGTDQGKWKSYVLMEMIEAPRGLGNAILRNGKVEKGQVIGELGVYGSVIWRSGLVAGADEDNIAGGKWILENKEAGYLLRTKRVESEEGGVAAGFGAVDSCLLV